MLLPAAGDASVAFSPFQPNASSGQPTLAFRVMQESGRALELPQYRIILADSADSSAGESWSGLGPFARCGPEKDRARDTNMGVGVA